MSRTGMPDMMLKVLLGIAALWTVVSAHHVHAQTPSILPIDIEVPFVGPLFPAEGKLHLVYELHVTNYWRKNLVMERVEVIDRQSDSPMMTTAGDQLAGDLKKPGHPSESSDPRLLEAGRVVVVFIWLTLDGEDAVPDHIYHRLVFSVVDSNEKAQRSVDGGLIAVPDDDPIALSAPFGHGYWLFGSGPSNSSDHRRAVLAVDGATWLHQRFAFDAMNLGEDGKLVRGDPAKNEHWTSYGKPVLAVSDATVVSVIDGIPDNTPLSSQRAVPMTRETHVGNCVVLDVGDQHFALYAHLKAGSIPVAIGDTVKLGQVVGQIGNSGNSEAPHLHFSLGTTPDPFSSEGLAYVFDEFSRVEVQIPGEEEVLSDGIAIPALEKAKRTRRTSEMPLGDPLLYFPER